MQSKTPNYKNLVNLINQSAYKAYIALAGGGQTFASQYLQHSGASKTIAGIHIPYGKQAFDQFVGKPVDKYVSIESARLMAKKAYFECTKQVDATHAIGIGLTCSIASDDEREGRSHRIIIAVHSYEKSWFESYTLRQGLSRQEEEMLCCHETMKALATAALKWEICQPLIIELSEYVPEIGCYLVDYHGDECSRLEFHNEIPKGTCRIAVAPGSYNPFHDGHGKMLEMAEEILGIKPYAELAVLNVDKGAIDYFDVRDRLGGMIDIKKIVTHVSTFKDKALFLAENGREIVFIVGADTWNRVLDAKYAGDTESLYHIFAGMNVRFMVFSRGGSDIVGDQWMDKLLIHDDRLSAFDVPLSSTQIRKMSNISNFGD